MPASPLAFRPARVVERLPPRSAACFLSSRDLIRAAVAARSTLPVVLAPSGAVARGALVAARQARSALGLALPRGARPEPWFVLVARAADEVAGELPVFLAGEVSVGGGGEAEVEAALTEAWRLADAGLTHLAVDLTAVEPWAQASALEPVAGAAHQRGLGLECVVTGGPAEAVALLGALSDRHDAPDVLSRRCPPATDGVAARTQLRELLALCAAAGGTPVLRRGPASPALLALLPGSPVAACHDDGLAAQAAWRALPAGAGADGATPWDRLAQAEQALEAAALEPAEAAAYAEVGELLERLGAAGSAPRLLASLAAERELDRRGAAR